MSRSPEHLTTRQDQLNPKKITVHVEELGQLQGWEFPNGVRQFYSIPYGRLTKNWTRATLADSWENKEHDGTRLGPWAVQPAPFDFLATFDTAKVKPFKHLNTPDEDDGDNCLTINLTVPPSDTGKPLPVMVFIHGGGFVYGSAHLPVYDGFRLVSESVRKGRPVVYAAINYRLGLFGFLASRDIAADLKSDGFEGNGNFAFTDQQTALHWINKYISQFQGDADNVTIFGESAGGMSVGCQWYAKKPAPFQRAIQHSGSPASFRCFSMEEHELLYSKTLQYFDISPEAPDALAQLQRIPNRQICAATLDIFGILEPLPSPCLDGWFWDEDHLPSPTSWNAPPPWLKGFMQGNVGSEGMIYRYTLAKETYETVRTAFLRHLSPETTDFIFALYDFHEDLSSAELLSSLEQMFADTVFYLPDEGRAQRTAAASSSTAPPSYFFHFDEKCAFPNNIYRGEAYHSFDLLFVFLTMYEELTREQQRLADAVHEAWIRFAHGEAPWEEYRLGRRWCTLGPDGKMDMVANGGGGARKHSRVKTLLRRADVVPGFARAVEDVSIKRYLISEERPKEWSKSLLETF
ncbi:Alpha/Beta hydrolase protein [Aspergillus germanicus]